MRAKSRRARRRWILLTAVAFLLALLLRRGDLDGLLPGGSGASRVSPQSMLTAGSGSFVVRVLRGEGGPPVEGATIRVSGVAGGETVYRSDETGKATLPGTGSFRIEASAGGRSASLWARARPDGHISLALKPPPTRTGKVRTTSGEPVATTVCLLDTGGRLLATTRSRPDGRYSLPDLPGAAAVCAEGTEGSAPASAPRGEVVLAPGVEWAGVLPGAREGDLEIYARVAASRGDGTLPLRACWKVAADGTFRGRLPRGASAWALYRGLPVALHEGRCRLPPRVALSGRVVDAAGRPAAHATLRFRALLDGGLPAPLPPRVLRADGSGRFADPDFPGVPCALLVRATGLATTLFPEVAAGAAPLTLVLEPGFSVSGRVVDAAGLPLERVVVRGAGTPHDSAVHPPVETMTDERGHYRLDGLAGTHADLEALLPGGETLRATGVAPGARTTLAAPPR